MASSYPGSVDSFDTRTTGQIIAASHVNDLQNSMVAVQTYAAKSALLQLPNGSGAAVAANDVGYIDNAGEFQTTTTEHLDGVSWCVVVEGGANGADIIVARKGQVTVELDQNCSAGDYLYTSTTTGRATTETYVRPGIFAVALTANSSGAGGTCDALLLAGRTNVPVTSTSSFYNKNSDHSGSEFRATMNGNASGTSVVYNAPLSGNEEFIEPDASLLTYMVLYNEDQDEEAYISSVNLGTNTITVTAAGDITNWVNGDTITVRSQTNTGTAQTFYYADLEIANTTTIPALAVAVELGASYRDSGAASEEMDLHPWDSYDGSKKTAIRTQVANVANEMLFPYTNIFNRRITFACSASGAGTVTSMNWRLKGYQIATP